MESCSDLVSQWLKWDKCSATRKEVEELVRFGSDEKLTAIMRPSLTFGTAGLRGIMGPGFARMNNLTVIQASQGLASYLLQVHGAEKARTRGIVIGFDGRHHSRKFARHAANVFLGRGFKTYLFSCVVPTPFVAFGVRHLRTLSGVMVTASHNPKEYNGYKVYNEIGAQIKSPVDKRVLAHIKANTEPQPYAWTDQAGAMDPFETVFEAYFGSLEDEWHFRKINSATPLRFTFTAMHGVGQRFTLHCLNRAGFEHINCVARQAEPDPEFPTVPSPNPEEGRAALRLALEQADATRSTVVLANDPDADRLAVAEKTTGGTWKLFTGDELGRLLVAFALELHRLFDPLTPLSRCAMMTTIVSSRFMRVVAETEGLHYEETLTGFKYLGNRAEELRREKGIKVLLCYEDAIGYMWGNRVLDKDGVTAAGVVAQMAAWLQATKNYTLFEYLEQLYKKYGYFENYNGYFRVSDPKRVQEMFAEIGKTGVADANKSQARYPETIAGAKVNYIRDLGTGYDSKAADEKTNLPISKSSPIITLGFDNGVVLTLRGSGTEPKLKWYSEIHGTKQTASRKNLCEFVDNVLIELVQPHRFGLSKVSKL